MKRLVCLAFIITLLATPEWSFARGPRGRVFGGQRVRSVGGRLFDGVTNAGRTVVNGVGRGVDRVSETLTGRERAVFVQAENEDQKLIQRQATAEKMREISDRTGNENLRATADKMDQQALDYYQKRNEKIDQLADRHEPTPAGTNVKNDVDPVADTAPVPPPPEEPLQNLNESESSQQRRLLNEERKLEHQLSVAQKLRDLAAKNGNENLIRTAERMELMAAEQYASQLEKLSLEEAPAPAESPVD